jgi:hypothetical protein
MIEVLECDHQLVAAEQAVELAGVDFRQVEARAAARFLDPHEGAHGRLEAIDAPVEHQCSLDLVRKLHGDKLPALLRFLFRNCLKTVKSLPAKARGARG